MADTPTATHEVDRLIERWQSHADLAALDRLLTLMYADLRAMAAQVLGGRKDHPTLQPTALVHDVCVRLLEERKLQVESGTHLFNLAARIMRQLLVDRARHAAREKHGGQLQRVDLIEALQLPIPEPDRLDLFDAAVNHLERIDRRLAEVVELRCFAGLSVPAVAAVLEVDERTVYRDWALAKLWLRDFMTENLS